MAWGVALIDGGGALGPNAPPCPEGARRTGLAPLCPEAAWRGGAWRAGPRGCAAGGRGRPSSFGFGLRSLGYGLDSRLD
eukprot:1532887-Prymnesium_polylepis.1